MSEQPSVSPESKKPRILIIEDDPSVASIYGDKFAREGFDVSIGTTGEEGLGLAFTQKPDIILLDILLPKMDGFDVLRELKTHDTTMMTPVIMWTNLSEHVDRAHSMGAVDYLIKVNTMPSDVVKRVKQRLGLPVLMI